MMQRSITIAQHAVIASRCIHSTAVVARRRDGRIPIDKRGAADKRGAKLDDDLPPVVLASTRLEDAQLPYPREIVNFLDKFVVGQVRAKRTLAVGVYQHYKRLVNNLRITEQLQYEEAVRQSKLLSMAAGRRRQRSRGIVDDKKLDNLERDAIKNKMEAETGMDDMYLEKSNIVLLGPSGSGKTYLTQKLAAILNVPIAMCDCTCLTQAGYVGDDVDTVIQKLLVDADGDVERAQQGIVFLDEFDKINTSSDPLHTSGNRDVGGRGVQQALLKLVEGTVVKVKNPLNPSVKVAVNTTNILFVASGAFSNMEKIVAKRIDERVLGFGSKVDTTRDDLDHKDERIAAQRKNELMEKVDQQDLIQFGMVPELVGRFPVVVTFTALDEEMLTRVLTEPQNNIVQQSEKLFKLDDIKLEFTDDAIREMAREAVQRKTGARALRSIIERVLLQPKFECPGSDVQTVVIDGNAVLGKGQYKTVTPQTPLLPHETTAASSPEDKVKLTKYWRDYMYNKYDKDNKNKKE